MLSETEETNMADEKQKDQTAEPKKNDPEILNNGVKSRSHNGSSRTINAGLKLFAKPTTKTNSVNIQNALLKTLEGPASAKKLKSVQDLIASRSQSQNHYLILFRTNRHQFGGLYEYDEKRNTTTKLDGVGPKTIKSEDIFKYYKFDPPKRQFTEVQTKHVSPTIVAFAIHDYLWSKTLSSRISSNDLVQHQKNGDSVNKVH